MAKTASLNSKHEKADRSEDAVDLWAMPFLKSGKRRRKKKGRLKGWALIRAKLSSIVVLHRLLGEDDGTGVAGIWVHKESKAIPQQGSSSNRSDSKKEAEEEEEQAELLTKGVLKEEDDESFSQLKRRKSQADFARVNQTIIVFDWDDTLFPTTYLRDDLNLSWRRPVEQQDLSRDAKREIQGHLERCERHAKELLQLAVGLGKVVLVTLARHPWVTECCKHFYPKVGQLIEENNIPIVYAQEDSNIDYDKQKMMSCEATEIFWATMKGKAIAKVISAFYSQYSGQTWKNIISVGDSDFERLGTFQAVDHYVKFSRLDTSGDHRLDIDEMKEFLKQEKPDITDLELSETFQGMDMNGDGLVDFAEFLDFLFSKRGEAMFNLLGVGINRNDRQRRNTYEGVDGDGTMFRLRTKTLKIIDEPTVEEMEAELPMMRKWLLPMVYLDSGCDFELDALDSWKNIKFIDDTLKDVKVPTRKNAKKPPHQSLRHEKHMDTRLSDNPRRSSSKGSLRKGAPPHIPKDAAHSFATKRVLTVVKSAIAG